MLRSPSQSTSNSGLTNHSPSSLTHVHPPPAYVAAFGASQVVSDAKRHFSEDEDDDNQVASNKVGHGDMEFSVGALVLLNAFLDQLLYSILSVAKSTTLVALRPAVVEVLKARLAGEAIASAEEELQELLAGGEEEEEEMNDRQTKSERQRRWDTELVWKRTRLRVMVYIRLGEMEDDDEERFVREDELFAGNDRRFSHSTGLVSWAAAIFLTSVVEFVAERVLEASSLAAASRARRRSRVLRVSMANTPGAVSPADRTTVVEESDMEKVALNSTLGRLWRTWRKSIRNNANAGHASPTPNTTHHQDRDLDHAHSPIASQRRNRDVLAAAGIVGARGSSFRPALDSMFAAGDPRCTSSLSAGGKEASENGAQTELGDEDELPEAEYPEHILAANIPIVVLDEQRDVKEIEIPGLARDPDAATQPLAPVQRRRHSFSGTVALPGIPTTIIEHGPLTLGSPENDSAKMPEPAVANIPRQRSHSEPMPKYLAFEEKVAEVATVETSAEGNGDAMDDKPEQKANAAEMAGLKRKVSPERTGVEAPKDTTVEDQSVADDEAASSKDVESASKDGEHLDNSAAAAAVGHKGLVGGAIAVASTAAAAAVSLVSGLKGNENEGALPTDAKEHNAMQQGGPSGGTNEREISTLAERLSSSSLRDEPEIMESKQVSMSPPPTPQRLIRTHNPMGSKDSFSLDDSSGQEVPVRPLAAPRQASLDTGKVEPVSEEADIGVARTSDTAVSTPHGEDAPEIESRDSSTRRPGQVALGTASSGALSSLGRKSASFERQTTEMSPEDFLHKRALSVSTSQQNDQSKAQARSLGDQARTPIKTSKRASGPSALIINHGEKVQTDKTPSPWRQSFSAAIEKNAGWASPKKKASSATLNEPEVPVQEHPVVQKIATIKKSESRSQEDEAPLTSANIMGSADFEMFVQGGDTVKYTLTPENVRDDPTFTNPSRTSERSISPTTPSHPDVRTGRSQTAKQTTSSRIIIQPDADVDDLMTSRSSRDTNRRSISRPVARNTSVHRRSGLMAREPQIVTESTRDFADFIRSTGPAKDPEVLPIVTNRSGASIQSLQSPSRPASAGGASARSMNRATKPDDSAPPVPPVPSGKSRSNLQPRNATSAADTSSELIDFIRSGPTFRGSLDEERQHRIPRTVAPFRTTMDSDQFTEWGARLANQPESKSSADTSLGPRSASRSSFKSSFRTSSNSKSALLTGSNNANEPDHPAHGSHAQSLASTLPTSVLPDASEPIRKRVRSKDPYALDMFDDEDDDGLFTGTSINRPQEESLIEFLRNSGPNTPNEPSSPANGALSGSRTNIALFPPRRSSNQGLKTLGADAVSMGRRGSGPNKEPFQQRNQSIARNGTTSTAVGPMTKPHTQLEARGGRNGSSGGTLDLSDYLRSSGPDANATIARQNSKIDSKSDKKKSRLSIFAFFTKGPRNERQGTKQYLDL